MDEKPYELSYIFEIMAPVKVFFFSGLKSLVFLMEALYSGVLKAFCMPKGGGGQVDFSSPIVKPSVFTFWADISLHTFCALCKGLYIVILKDLDIFP